MSATGRTDISVGEMRALAAGLAGCDPELVEHAAIVIIHACPEPGGVLRAAVECAGHTTVGGTAGEAGLMQILASGIGALTEILGRRLAEEGGE
jgi:hypothetical protein